MVSLDCCRAPTANTHTKAVHTDSLGSGSGKSSAVSEANATDAGESRCDRPFCVWCYSPLCVAPVAAMFSDVPRTSEEVSRIPALLTVSLLSKGGLQSPRQMAAGMVLVEGEPMTVVAIAQGSKVALFKVTSDPVDAWTMLPFGVLGEAVAGWCSPSLRSMTAEAALCFCCFLRWLGGSRSRARCSTTRWCYQLRFICPMAGVRRGGS